MSYFGTTDIGKMNFGDVGIGKAYLGDDLVFSSGGDVPIVLPAGFTRLSYIKNITSRYNTDIVAYGSEWEFVLQHTAIPTSSNQVIVAFEGNGGAGEYAGALKNGYWGLGVNDISQYTSVPVTDKAKIKVAWYTGQSSATMTIGNETITRAYTSTIGTKKVRLFGIVEVTDIYKGKIYSVKCTAGGNFHGIPARRDSDNKEGLYDIENNTFIVLK